MTKKSILKWFVQFIVVVTIAICAWCTPSSYRGWITGFVGFILLDIYGTLIEKKKL